MISEFDRPTLFAAALVDQAQKHRESPATRSRRFKGHDDMDIDAQDAVCAFVRDIISARTNEKIEISARPDRDERNFQAVEELWESPTRRYAIEHTRVEAFEGQIANQARIIRLLVPVKIPKHVVLSGFVGRWTPSVRSSGSGLPTTDERPCLPWSQTTFTPSLLFPRPESSGQASDNVIWNAGPVRPLPS